VYRIKKLKIGQGATKGYRAIIIIIIINIRNKQQEDIDTSLKVHPNIGELRMF
jgi:hypothetical protein